MPKQNQQDRLCAALASRGLKEVTATTRKYRVFTGRTEGQFYFVGKAGALRRGRTVTDSVSLERTLFRAELLREGQL